MTIWPRMMKRQTAAAYCDLSVGAFEREITAGRLPAPVTLGGREHWCKKALDRALAGLFQRWLLPQLWGAKGWPNKARRRRIYGCRHGRSL